MCEGQTVPESVLCQSSLWNTADRREFMCQMILSPIARPLSAGTKMEGFVRGRFIMEAKWGLTATWMTCFTTHSLRSLPPSPVFWFLSVFLELRLLFLLSAHSKSSEVTTGWTNSVNLAALLCCQDNRVWWGNYLGVGIQRATTAETWYVVMELNYRPVCVCVHMTWTSWQWYS